MISPHFSSLRDISRRIYYTRRYFSRWPKPTASMRFRFFERPRHNMMIEQASVPDALGFLPRFRHIDGPFLLLLPMIGDNARDFRFSYYFGRHFTNIEKADFEEPRHASRALIDIMQAWRRALRHGRFLCYAADYFRAMAIEHRQLFPAGNTRDMPSRRYFRGLLAGLRLKA